jgi:putative acetyltransferase
VEIRQNDLSGEQTQSLLEIHLRGMHENSPPGHVFALDLSGLQSPDVTVWGAWDGEVLTGIGALKQFAPKAGEVKSMRTHPAHLRRGVAALLLEHIISTARLRGFRQLSLETGSGAAFDPALALYRSRGFVEGGAFGDYRPSDFNRFLHLAL